MNPNIQPSLNAFSTVTVLFDNDIVEGRPNLVVMRPVRRAGEQFNDFQIMGQLAALMKREVYRLLQNYLPFWTLQQLRNNVRGSLMMYNWDNEAHTHIDDITLEDLNGEFFDEQFQNATANGSNPDLTIYDVEWKVWINPNSLLVGGQSKFTNPKKLQGIDMWNRRLIQTKGIEHEDVGCAAFALALGRDLVENVYTSKKNIRWRQPAYTRYVYDLQNALNFPDPKLVSVEQLRRYIEIYNDYRIVVITAMFNQPSIMIGNAYVKNDNPKQDKTIYIYHDLLTHHFVTITGIINFIQHFEGNRGGSVKWCYDCCTKYSSMSDKTCFCGLKKGTYKNRNKSQHCVDCGEEYYKNKKKPHICGQSACKFCQMYYKVGAVGEHRCPLYLDPSKIEKVFVGDENEYFHREGKEEKNEKHQFELWAWDIESHFIQVADKEETDFYETDSNGVFIFDKTEIKVHRIKKLAHLGNYIYAKNVFTGIIYLI